MKHNFFTRTYILPLALLIYLAVLAWMARGRFYSGDYLYYFGVIGGSLLIIALLFLVLRKRDRLRRAREEDQYTTYAEDNEQDSAQ
ncbi:MAG: hypothetical protein J6I72_01290 [Muribaculaceae bacterium]|nr:hypothetical protein [Muribaculaceae bacterium]